MGERRMVRSNREAPRQSERKAFAVDGQDQIRMGRADLCRDLVQSPPEARQTRQNLDQTEDRKILHREQGGQPLFHHFRAADPDEMERAMACAERRHDRRADAVARRLAGEDEDRPGGIRRRPSHG